MIRAERAQQLESMIDELTKSRAALTAQFVTEFPGVNPALIRDAAGRSILLDSLVALANMTAELSHLEENGYSAST